jgi:thiosulfate/3-mercaptopyruvate sulfurtransferase
MTVWDTLVTPAQLATRLTDAECVVFDCRHQLQDKAYGARVYASGHIPGARFADIDHDLSAPIRPDTGRHPLPAVDSFLAWLGAQGVTPRHQVVAYDDSQGAFAARLWWMLRQLGHRDVAVLDGGYARWTREGRAVSVDVPKPKPAGYPARINAAAYAELAEVVALSRNGGGALVDARGGERYRGEQEPIDPQAGHIPGAVNLPYTENLNPDGTFLPPARLRERLLGALGSGDPATSVHYCGSGVSACHNLLAMAVAGLPPGRLFVGSWSLWSKDPARPIAIGPQPK